MSNYFEQILALNDGPVSYESVSGGNLKMKNHQYPYSIKQSEFDFLTDLVTKYNLQRGYECATAFGISSLAIGLGFKNTGGRCVTMDAYVEEVLDNPGAYENIDPLVYEKSDGYKSVNYLIDKFGLRDILYPEIGWSPYDTEKSIRKWIKEPLDFVFIDAGHFEHQMIKDISSFVPLLGEKYVIAFHDVYPWSFTDKVHEHLYNLIGKRVEIMLPQPHGENLGVVINV
jgi:predicted O-methyltransferase YrrM